MRRNHFPTLSLLLLAAACSPQNPAAGPHLRIITSIQPQAWFAKRISGGTVPVTVLIPAGRDHHSYEITPRQMKELSSAAAWILSGLEFEESLKPKVSALYPGLLQTDPNRGIQFRKADSHAHETGRPDGHHHHHPARDSTDPHTWLGMEESRIIAANIRDLLIRLNPENAAGYERNHKILDAEISETFQSLRKNLTPLKGRKIFVYHPAFGYFFDAFGIAQIPIEAEGKDPGARTLGRLINEAKEKNAAAIFVQKGFSDKAAKTLASSIGAEVAALDPMAPDWLANIRAMGQTLLKAAGRPSP